MSMSVYQVHTFPLLKSCRLWSLTLLARVSNGRVVGEGLLHGDGGDQVAEEPVRRTEGGCRPPLHPRPTGSFHRIIHFQFWKDLSPIRLFNSLRRRIQAETELKPSQAKKS
jgi:hypothetical protein